MTLLQNPILRRIGYRVTRTMMWEPLRRTALGRSTYTHLYLLGKRLAERREQQLFRRYLEPGMTIVDMGANVGFYAVQFSRLVGERGAVHAFEPDPFCSRILRDRVRALPHQNVHVESAALGETEGEITLFCSKRDRAENRVYPFDPAVPVETARVPVLRLDTYCRTRGIDRIDAVKMDVEGAEVSVLGGMREIMAKSPPTWMFIEFSPEQLRGAGSSPEAFWRALSRDGYVCYAILDRGEFRKISDTAAFTEAHAQSYTNIWAAHRAYPQPPAG